MKKLTALITLAGLAIASSALAADIDWSKLPPAATTPNVTFDKDIAPLLKASCVRCHSGDRARAGLSLDTLAGVLKGTKQGPVLTAGKSADSLLVQSISQLDPKTAMPPKPRNRRAPGGPGGTNAPAAQPQGGGQMGGPEGQAGPGGPGGPGGVGGGPRGPQVKPLTAEEVGLVRAWIDQGAK